MSNEVSCDSVARRVNGENPLDVLVGVSTPYGPLLTDDYVRRPDRSIIVSDDCWNALIEVFDVPDEQALDCLCLAIRCGGAWPVDGEGGGAMV